MERRPPVEKNGREAGAWVDRPQRKRVLQSSDSHHHDEKRARGEKSEKGAVALAEWEDPRGILMDAADSTEDDFGEWGEGGEVLDQQTSAKFLSALHASSFNASVRAVGDMARDADASVTVPCPICPSGVLILPRPAVLLCTACDVVINTQSDSISLENVEALLRACYDEHKECPVGIRFGMAQSVLGYELLHYKCAGCGAVSAVM